MPAFGWKYYHRKKIKLNIEWNKISHSKKTQVPNLMNQEMFYNSTWNL